MAERRMTTLKYTTSLSYIDNISDQSLTLQLPSQAHKVTLWEVDLDHLPAPAVGARRLLLCARCAAAPPPVSTTRSRY